MGDSRIIASSDGAKEMSYRESDGYVIIEFRTRGKNGQTRVGSRISFPVEYKEALISALQGNETEETIL